MKELFTSMLQALSDGQSVVLCSILASSGSTPRGAGAKMAVFADGHTVGTIGGGAVEKRSGEKALEVLQSKQSPRAQPGRRHRHDLRRQCDGLFPVL